MQVVSQSSVSIKTERFGNKMVLTGYLKIKTFFYGRVDKKKHLLKHYFLFLFKHHGRHI